MTHEYDDPFSPEAIDAAVIRVLELRRETPAAPLDQHVETAVHEHFCSCAVDIEDQIEHRRSGIHQTITAEIRQRVERRLNAADNCVDEASKDSFPASDPARLDWETAVDLIDTGDMHRNSRREGCAGANVVAAIVLIGCSQRVRP